MDDNLLQFPMQNYMQQAQQLSHVEQSNLQQMQPVQFQIDDPMRLKSALVHIDQLSENDVFVLMRDNIDSFVRDMLRNDKFFVPYTTQNEKFIKATIRAFHVVSPEYMRQTCANKLYYEFCAFDDQNCHPDIRQLYHNLSLVINRDTINSLMAFDIPEYVAAILAMTRRSSLKERINVRRLNFAIEQQDPMLMTSQKIVYIYETLFDRLADLFLSTIFEVYSTEEELQLGEEFMEVCSNVDIAILTIVNNLPLDKIRTLFRIYADELQNRKSRMYRFSLIALSQDFGRVVQIAEELNAAGYYIP